MNPWAAGLLGTGGLLSGLGILYNIYVGIRDRRIDLTKKETGVALDDTTRERIAAEAAQINSDVAIAQQDWWKQQFDAVRTELIEEQKLRRRLTRWADAHQEWDQATWTLALQTDPTCPPPPVLEHD